MLRNTSKSLNSVFIRHLSNLAVKQSSSSHQNVQISKALNGVTVASLENNSPVTRVGILFNAGSRYEEPGNLGASHALRILSNHNSKKATAFNISRSLQQIGANFSCTTTREHMIYSVEVARDQIKTAIHNLGQIATSPAFNFWDSDEVKERMIKDKQILKTDLNARLGEMLHKAVYRRNLGNSLYYNKDLISSFNMQKVEEFYNNHCTANNAVVVAIGMNHDQLLDEMKPIFFKENGGFEKKIATFNSGEIRKEINSNLAFISIVTEGVGLSDPDLLPLALLQHVIGIEPCLSISTNQVSDIHKAVSSVANGPFALSSLCSSYSDSGMFGVNIICQPKEAYKSLNAISLVMDKYAKGNFEKEKIEPAKKSLKKAIHFYRENPIEYLESLGVEVILTGQFVTLQQVDSIIDSITYDDVVKIAKKIISRRPAMAAIGDLSHTPYLDEILPI